MAQKTIKDLSSLSGENFDPNEYWLVVQKGVRSGVSQSGATHRMLASAALKQTTIKSEYCEFEWKQFSSTGSSLSFTQNNLFSDNSSTEIILEFGSSLMMPSARIIKNSQQGISIVTYEGVQSLDVDESQSIHLSEYTNYLQNNSIVSADILFTINGFSLSNLKIENTTEIGSITSAYCAARARATIIA